jgi:hypothetical protein
MQCIWLTNRRGLGIAFTSDLAANSIRLKQARRCLEALGKPPAPVKEVDRLEELEKKIDRLQKDMEALKKRLPPE